jgi:O-methyltransferase/methyltransferase family protein
LLPRAAAKTGTHPRSRAQFSANDSAPALRELIWGFMSSQIVGAIAAFGVADRVAEGSTDVSTVAERVRIEPQTLYRLMRAGASLGILSETEPHVFALTSMGELLRSEVPGSLRAHAISFTDPWQWLPWTFFRDAIATGEPQAERALGDAVFEYLKANPTQEVHFAEAMGASSDALVGGVLHAFDFSPFNHIVDVGASRGNFVRAVLDRYPQARATCFDRPSLAPAAMSAIRENRLEHRCQVVGGDFFQAVPSGGDLYVLKLIIHDWADDRAITILRNVRAAMASSSKVLLVEMLVPPSGEQSLRTHRSDLSMLLTFGSRERSLPEYTALLDEAGLVLEQVIPLRDEWALLLAAPAGAR